MKSSSSYVSSFILIKALRGRCLLFNFSIEETQGERCETAYSRSPSLKATELGCALQSGDPLGTEENPKWTHSCLQRIRIKCLQISNYRAIVQNISSTQSLDGVGPSNAKTWQRVGFPSVQQPGVPLVRTRGRQREEGREVSQSHVSCERNTEQENAPGRPQGAYGEITNPKHGGHVGWGHSVSPPTPTSLFTRRV